MVVGVVASLARVRTYYCKLTEISDGGKIFNIKSFQGEFDYPDASKWTDQELGIPPDDYVE